MEGIRRITNILVCGIFVFKYFIQLSGLISTVAYDHAADGCIIHCSPAFFEIRYNIVKHWHHKAGVGVNELAIHIAHFNFHFFQCLL